ncbi:MAG: hypothetical protein AW07_02487 [Candidatus Accumulibacter sp. SK-11]|nr:MAG: hypothetical protein AW07_02487 [Candidatus Accumulibacter sp. SK-11]
MKPTRRSLPGSAKFSGETSDSARSRRSRSNISGSRRPAALGTITQRPTSLVKPAALWALRSPVRTTPLTWQMRVVMRRITGTSKRSESSKAASVMSCASCESAGSSTGTCAKRPQ